ncbi:MAG: hypothetical protein AAGH41_00650 [Pseudomonadota bacterium]
MARKTPVTDAPPARETDLPALPAGWFAATYKVLATGELAVALADVDLGYGSAEASLSIPRNAQAKICVLGEGQWLEALSFPLGQLRYPEFDQLPDGRWLVANARSRGEQNASIFGLDGFEERRIVLGDGIAHIQIDRRSNICVGWFNEGVFGNANAAWRVEDLQWPPSSYGVAAFDEHGAVLQVADGHVVSDCYALNVWGDEAWFCPYTDFPICRFRNGSDQAWATELRGPVAVAVRFPLVLAAGGYGEDFNEAVLLMIDGEEANVLGTWSLPFGVNDRKSLRYFDGRNDTISVVTGDRWLQWSVEDFLS